MFVIEPETIAALAEVVRTGFVGLSPIIAVFIAMPLVFYVAYRIKNIFPRIK